MEYCSVQRNVQPAAAFGTPARGAGRAPGRPASDQRAFKGRLEITLRKSRLRTGDKGRDTSADLYFVTRWCGTGFYGAACFLYGEAGRIERMRRATRAAPATAATAGIPIVVRPGCWLRLAVSALADSTKEARWNLS